jgi:hypothetical protein
MPRTAQVVLFISSFLGDKKTELSGPLKEAIRIEVSIGSATGWGT